MIQNTINSWYYTSLFWIKQTTESLLCDIKLLQRVYYVISSYRYHVQRIYVSWIILDRVIKNVINTKQWHQYCITTSIPSYLIIFPVKNKSHSCMSSTRRFYFTRTFKCMFESIYLKYLKYLKYGPKFKPRISNDTWPHVLRYKVESHFPCF